MPWQFSCRDMCKLWHDWIIRIKIKTNRIFARFHLRAENIEWNGPWWILAWMHCFWVSDTVLCSLRHEYHECRCYDWRHEYHYDNRQSMVMWCHWRTLLVVMNMFILRTRSSFVCTVHKPYKIQPIIWAVRETNARQCKCILSWASRWNFV